MVEAGKKIYTLCFKQLRCIYQALNQKGNDYGSADDFRRLSENGYFSQTLRQDQIIILEILKCIPVVIIIVFLDLEQTISFSDKLLWYFKIIYKEIVWPRL